MFDFIRLIFGEKSELKKLNEKTGIGLKVLKEIQDDYKLESILLNINWRDIKAQKKKKEKIKIIKKIIKKILDAVEIDIKKNYITIESINHLLKISPPKSQKHIELIKEYNYHNQIENLFNLWKKSLNEQLKIINEIEADIFLKQFEVKKELLEERISAEEYYLEQVFKAMEYMMRGRLKFQYLFNKKKYTLSFHDIDVSMFHRIHLMNKLEFIKTEGSCEGHAEKEIEDESGMNKYKLDKDIALLKRPFIYFKIDEKNPLAQKFLRDLNILKSHYPDLIIFEKIKDKWHFELNYKKYIKKDTDLIKKLDKKIEIAKKSKKFDEILNVDLDLIYAVYANPFTINRKLAETLIKKFKKIWYLFDKILEKYIQK